MEIITGIHQIKGIRGVNCYAVISESEILIVDTGMPGNAKKIIHYVQSIGRKPSEIKYILLTHGDIDHTGSAAELKKLTGAKVGIHAGDAQILSGKIGFKPIKGPLGLLFKLMRPFLRFQAVNPDILLTNGMEIMGCQVIYTPGHSEGSICLYQPGKVVFAGDALRSDSRGNPTLPSRRASTDIQQAVASLNLIANLDFDVLLVGHGAPVTGKAASKVRDLIAQAK